MRRQGARTFLLELHDRQYFYFHLYLQRLWRGLSTLPARFPDGYALDEKAYPWLLNGLVGAHFKRLKDRRRPLSRVENFVSIVLAWWVIPLTLVAFWLFLLPRHDWIGTGFQVLFIAVTTGVGIYSYQLTVLTLRGTVESAQQQNEPLAVRRSLESSSFAVAAVLILAMLSFGVIFAPGSGQDPLSAFGVHASANLREAELSIPPSDWTGDVGRVRGADLRQGSSPGRSDRSVSGQGEAGRGRPARCEPPRCRSSGSRPLK